MNQKYFKVTEVAKIFSMKPARIRELCHARGQRFAFQPVKNGNILIDITEFEKWLKIYRA